MLLGTTNEADKIGYITFTPTTGKSHYTITALFTS
jgi:hypothetical protein